LLPEKVSFVEAFLLRVANRIPKGVSTIIHCFHRKPGLPEIFNPYHAMVLFEPGLF
jgi:hypothetical protein